MSPKKCVLRLLCPHPGFASQPSSAFLGRWPLFSELPLWKSEPGNQKVSRYVSPLPAAALLCKRARRPAAAVDSPQCLASEQTPSLPSPHRSQEGSEELAPNWTHTRFGRAMVTPAQVTPHALSALSPVWERECAFDTFLWPPLLFFC